ncbi:pyridoxal phosphate-dependent aminotransferase [Liquorilactobacillus oeni]|uniref:Aminotransferase n=1 Tax=Liquorilactobacillus oeni DSM 19972 TaxID=1423777 RepID=A0A0R1MGW4_9LACO|nr:pyridoxal phosphate-dependent aminotransferase [Liquorilactobacillus oeni]KRL04581.1 aromatic amino acid aminotransferase [Liquorilactobacillus oeni DSM 19972]
MAKNKFNEKIEQIAISDIRQFDEEASAIPGIIKLTLGEPDFNTPEHIKKAAVKAISDNQTHYLPNAGLPVLRKAAAEYYNEKFALNFKPEQVVTTVGATEGIAASIQAILNPDETIIVPTPIFPLYIPITKINDGRVVLVDTSKDGFVLTAERLRQVIEEYPLAKFKAVVLNYPSNPTGVTYSRKQLEELAEVIREEHLWVISDEIYAELTYKKKHVSMAQILPEKTILVTGLSKSHAMTGWRIGFLLGPQDFVDQVVKAHQNMVTCATSISQYAALEAMSNGKKDSLPMRQEYARRRDFMIKELTQVGFKIASPDGAFYLFAKIPANCSQDSWNFVRDLAQRAKVALIPGISFGPGGEGYVRLSYAASYADLEEAAKRIQQYVKARGVAETEKEK